MNLSLPPRLDALVRDKVDSGAYRSASAVIVEALLLFEEREQVRRLRRERLLAEIAKGLQQAENHQLVDEDDVFSALAEKHTSSET
jgi:antitoxin ParD1/3/4